MITQFPPTRETIIFILIVLLMIIGILIIGILFFTNPLKFKCDIGKPEVVGDYKIQGADSWNPKIFHFCAVEDCVAFNKLNGEYSCVV